MENYELETMTIQDILDLAALIENADHSIGPFTTDEINQTLFNLGIADQNGTLLTEQDTDNPIAQHTIRIIADLLF